MTKKDNFKVKDRDKKVEYMIEYRGKLSKNKLKKSEMWIKYKQNINRI